MSKYKEFIEFMAPIVFIICMIGLIVMFSCSIHTMGSNVYGQMDELRREVRSHRTVYDHVHRYYDGRVKY